MDFANERVEAHNIWPSKKSFKAEKMFADRLSEKGDIAPFNPINIAHNKDAEYQRCVGHLLDALDQMPNRPDYAFDHFFRIIDIAGTSLSLGKGIKAVVQKVSAPLLAQDKQSWDAIIDGLCEAMPLRTYEFLAKRLLSAASVNGSNPGLNTRATHAFGSNFYSAFVSKYTLDGQGNLIADAGTVNRASAAKLLKLYMSGKAGTRIKLASHPALDLTDASNIPSYEKRSEVFLSLLLFQVRNERAHGSVISPFRTSKSRLERYESCYFIMLVSYIYALGVMNLHYGCLPPADLLKGCQENIKSQASFF